jgi:NADP-dependent 3-hydroxy acid dehydrogenase YdfG
MIEQSYLKNLLKIIMITGVSAGMGVVMAMFMSSFEFNSQM